ncbi:MAG TPA: 50S ribosomal protein L30 [Candidatus Marinimicrobia bacterium]|jgi:large subunit ribosomal protein L30|nr:MAG: 50S ribosomal protein L30 [Candidatus Marinimicrobia bacterium CG1_02_48_14]PIZ69370.1 MAG: 50S ribosomal protein L30 [Candidatus Marinimicrobia bacterium CG_4_10_14_0_2_um_filter_48_9]PJA54072.1 MAG: 50S ribosomal protein L30 [Candidatus Marinimicrobia bacterium CG_4_9_14_3_um_filter_48_9]HCW77395.1 50S ribosomal protein L30 [Candidatus Neomarinimicrobiota bacterium]
MTAKTTIDKVKVTQIRSVIGQVEKHKRTIEALGLKRIRHTVVHDLTPAIQGMLTQVKHLVTVEKV